MLCGSLWLRGLRLEQTPRPDFSVQFEESKADFSGAVGFFGAGMISVASQATGYVYVRPFARLFLEVAARLFEARTPDSVKHSTLQPAVSGC